MFRILAIVMCVSLSFYASVQAKVADPVIIKVKINGKTVKVQQFDMTANLLEFRPLTVIERLRIWGSKPPEMRPPSTYIADCFFDQSSPTNQPDCSVYYKKADDIPHQHFAETQFRYFRPKLPEPNFDPKRKGGNIIYFAKYRFAIDPNDYPKEDPEVATLTDLSMFGDWRLKADDIEIPPVAIRNGSSGRLTYRCLVQSDRLLSCYGVSFEPPYGGDVFIALAKNIGAGQKAPATLTDGRSSVGTKFQGMISFQIP